jgi:hypothetical protein
MNQAAGDRYEMVSMPVDVASRMLRARDYKFIDAGVEDYNRHLLLIVDPAFWLWYQNKIKAWSIESNVAVKIDGLILEFNSKEDKLMFVLAWA